MRNSWRQTLRKRLRCGKEDGTHDTAGIRTKAEEKMRLRARIEDEKKTHRQPRIVFGMTFCRPSESYVMLHENRSDTIRVPAGQTKTTRRRLCLYMYIICI